MPRTIVTRLREKKVAGEIYIDIEKPCTGDDYNDVTIITDSLVNYWDNMTKEYSSSKGCLMPAKYLSNIFDRQLNMPETRCSSPLSELKIYLAIFLIGVVFIVVLCAFMVIEHKDAHFSITTPADYHVVNYSRVLSESVTYSERHVAHDVQLGLASTNRKERTLQNVTTYLSGLTERLHPQLYRSRHISFGIATITFMIIPIFCIIKVIMSHLKKGNAAQNIETKKFQTFKRAKILFETLQRATEYANDIQEHVTYKKEFFSRNDVIDALHSMKNARSDVIADT